MKNFIINTKWLNWAITFIVFYVVTGIAGGNPSPGIILAILVFMYFNPENKEKGTLSIRGNQYTYIIADRTNLSSIKGNGFLVNLNSNVPNIFIDQHPNDKRIELIKNFKNLFPQKLESTFGTSTTIYAKAEDRLEVLTLLHPASMEAIQKYAKYFDVEFAGSSLILWSDKKITHRPELKAEAIMAVQKIIESIEQTLSRSAYRNPDYTKMEVHESDKLLKVGSIRLGSIRKIICILFAVAITIFFIVFMQNTFTDEARQESGIGTIRIIAFIAWLCIIFPIIYIGFTRKKIDIHW